MNNERGVLMIVVKRKDAEISNGKFHSMLWVRGIGCHQLPHSDKVLSLFQPDTVMPREFLATYKRTLHLDPERALMLAVLVDAVTCFQDYLFASGKSKRTLFRQTEEWLFEEDHLYLFSFENICDLLGFNPDYLRRGLLRWKTAALDKGPGARSGRLRSLVARASTSAQMKSL